ncbi:MAG: hypothetical protein GXP55_05970, partial [Deltaproteobacteria bacterium]|nr:hypothetical protein [Deltaproteobacteria bacterium]
MIALALLHAQPAEARVVAAPPPSLRVLSSGEPSASGWALVADLDDDDDDGTPDAQQERGVPTRDLLPMRAGAPGERARLSALGPVRIIVAGRPRATLEVRGVVSFFVQGLAASESPGDASVHLTRPTGDTAISRFTVVGLGFVRADGSRLDSAGQALGVSHAISNDPGLPRGPATGRRPDDPEALRLELKDVSASGVSELALRSGAPDEAPRDSRPHLALSPSGAHRWSSAWLRLVGDAVDERAPGVGAQTLRVGLRDRVEILYQ